MNVYRIEHQESKIGPYQSSDIELDTWHYYGDKCPSPGDDGVYGVTREHNFGFATVRHLVRWFRLRDIFKMRKRGFRVYKFKIQDDYVCSGERQVAFVRVKAYSRTEVKLSLLAKHLCFTRFGS